MLPRDRQPIDLCQKYIPQATYQQFFKLTPHKAFLKLFVGQDIDEMMKEKLYWHRVRMFAVSIGCFILGGYTLVKFMHTSKFRIIKLFILPLTIIIAPPMILGHLAIKNIQYHKRQLYDRQKLAYKKLQLTGDIAYIKPGATIVDV